MVNLFRQLTKNLRINLRRVAFEGVGLTVLMLLIILILVSNIFRVLQNGMNNYEIYKYEREALEKIQKNNKELVLEKQLSLTDDELLLLARESQNLALPGEQLLETKDSKSFFIPEIELLSVTEEDLSEELWDGLL